MMTNMKTICRRFKNTLGISMILSAFILINVLVSVTARATHSADYDGLSVELQSAAGGHTELSDAYEPALLEAELAADRQQNTLESMEELQTERILINATTQNVIEKRADISYLDTEEYSDETESDESMHTTTTHVTPTTTELLYELPTTTPAMRSISKEYARKGKKQDYELPTRSAVDYAEEAQEEEVEDEDVMEVPQDPLNIQPTTEAADEHLEPYAMKFYGSEQKSTEEDVPMQDSLEVHSNKLPEYQQLPAVHAVLPRFNVDTIEHKLEPTAIAVVPDYRQPIVVQAAPGLPAFLVSLSNAAPTKSSYPMTATPAPLATQSTVTTVSPLATTTTTTTIISTTSRPVGKQGKQINIPTRRKLLPHEQLRNYIEDAYIRMPLAVIVDPAMESLQKTKALWREALQTNLNIKIVLVALNDSGEPSVYAFNNTQQFLAGLNGVKEHPSGNAFIGIMHAAELIPYDSAVFISTADVPQHIDLVQDAAITLLKKRIRLYLMWYGEQAASENETQEALGGILGEVALRSGGEILHIVGNDNSQEIEGSTLTIIADALRGSQQVDIPVDTTLSSLHVKIDAPMRSATLETPNGEEINLKKLVNFKSRLGMESEHTNTRLDAYIPLGKLRKSTTFKLKTIPESKETEYQVFVRGELKADLFLENVIKRLHDYMGKESAPQAKSMKTHEDMRFPADVDNERDEEPKNRIGGPKTEVETFSNEVIHQAVAHNKSIRAEIVNENANIQNARAYNLLQSGTTRIEIGVQSQLILTPGSPTQIYFEITNTRSESVAHNIQVTDERSWLQRLVPQQIVLRPSEKAVITLIVLAPANAAQGTNDRVTFTCHGGTGGSVSQPLNLKVYSQLEARDTTWPTINWEYGSRCDSIPENSANCAESFWSLDVTAQDWESGIKRLESTPEGLIYRNTFTIGSNDLLRATYISSCCEPKVTLLAYDVAGNQRSYTVNVRDIYLTPATITAIVLGVFLVILIIAIIVALIVWRNRRRKLLLNLPTYRSHSRQSRET